jgi:Zn-finger protein
MTVVDRETVRVTAGRMLRSEDLDGRERENAAEFLREHLAPGNPHMVRCDWCHETLMLFRDEDMGSFTRTERGWRCTKCDEHARSQEVRF